MEMKKMGKQIELTPENEVALKHFKADLYMRSASLIDDSDVVNRLLKAVFTSTGLGFCYGEE